MEAQHGNVKASIIQAAGRLFVDRGYHSTTIRDICAEAGVNLAAVNYHFGDKKSLYVAVINHYKDNAFKKFPLDHGIREGDSPPSKITSFVYAMVLRMFDKDSELPFGKLLVRELIEPTGELDHLIRDIFRPSFLKLSSLVREILGETATDQTVFLCSMSIVGQCLHFRHSPRLISRLNKKKRFSSKDIQSLADHISRFSLAALENYVPPKSTSPKG
jgi:AcrR family transcriptional regulator